MHKAMRLPSGICRTAFKARQRCISRPAAMPHGLTQAEMKFIQFRLTTLGFDTIGADGFAGPNTEIAIEAYQAAQHLPVDGFAGLSLLKRLQST